MSARAVRATFVLGALVALSGCDCGHRPSTGQKLGELSVRWVDLDGREVWSREARFDFGAAYVGERIPKKLVVKNQGLGYLHLSALELVDGAPVSFAEQAVENASFEVRFAADAVLGPQEEVEMEMFFTPRALSGGAISSEQRSTLKLTVAGAEEGLGQAELVLVGSAQSLQCRVPRELDFGPVPVGERFVLPLTLDNASQVDTVATVGAPFSQTGDHAAFGFAASSPKGDIPLPARGSATVVFEFGPTEKRAYEARVRLRAGANCPEAEAVLKGEGSDDVLSWAPASLDFGYVSPNTPGLKAVQFVNRSKASVRIRAVKTAHAEFTVKPEAGKDPAVFDIPGGGQPVPLWLVCQPTSLGPRSSTLTFDTGLKQGTGSVELKCYGGGPNISVVPRPTLNFGKVPFFAGTTSGTVRKLTVMNTGTRPPNGDKAGNLFLGQVTAQGPGQLPFVSVVPKNGTTAANEFVVGIPSTYDPAVGLEASAGKNLVDLLVQLSPKSAGRKEAELTLYSNDPDEPALRLTLVADAAVVPPCLYSLTPAAELNFGLVTPPTAKELPVTITNLGKNAGDLCLLSGLELGAGTDPAYSLPGGTVASKELQPGESYSVVVKVWPQGQVPSGVVTLSGYLSFNISTPNKPQVSLPLKTSMGPACLTVAPEEIDFGNVKKGCASTTRTFNVYNTCSQAVTLTGFAMQAAAGQAPGGPDCPGNSPCPEFHLVQTPQVPPSGLTLSAGAAPVAFTGRYRPIDLGTDNGALAVHAIQGGQNVTYLVSLKGTGDVAGLQTDTFKQDARPKADILLTVDDSCSMQDKQTSLANNFASFIQYAQAWNADYQIGVTTTDDDDAVYLGGILMKPEGPKGKLIGSASNPKILTPATPNLEALFKQKVQVGTNGSGLEQGMNTALEAVTPPLVTSQNAGFLRPDANLAVVVVTDAPDQSPQPVTYYFNRFLNVKGFNKANMFTFNVVGPFLSAAPSGCTYDGTPDTKYESLATQTGGLKEEICATNWSQKLKDLGKVALGVRTVFFLNNTPDLSGGKTLEVKIDGQAVPASAGGVTQWSYDPASNSVKFDPSKTPNPGQTLTVTYQTACL